MYHVHGDGHRKHRVLRSDAERLTGSQGDCNIAFTSSAVFTLYKNGSSIGTATIPAATTGRNVATLSFASKVTFAPGDSFSLKAPSSQDATGQHFSFSFSFNGDRQWL